MVDLARVGIGVVVKEGAPLPDISTVDALRKTLLNAKSIAHPDPKGGGFTGAHIDRMFERLGIADAVRPKVMLGYAFTGGVANIAKGVAEIGLFNISEIVPVKGVHAGRAVAGGAPELPGLCRRAACARRLAGAGGGVSSLADRAGRARRLEGRRHGGRSPAGITRICLNLRACAPSAACRIA